MHLINAIHPDSFYENYILLATGMECDLDERESVVYGWPHQFGFLYFQERRI